MAVKRPFRASLIAPCGMDCAICMAFLREKNRCPGCRSPDRRHHEHCQIFACEKRTGRYCFRCAEFPCSRMELLDKRYRTRYGMSMLENLDAIRQNGTRMFIRAEEGRWICRACGGTIDVHHGCCSKCGKERERKHYR
ncbi:MAG: DUF3795 domain-containing protein [Methanoregula sp.]|jgi:hypothetical protein|uniref:DUF3795 domain-containing protein n=1 Tax=Methanoregula sp. TaxID=2052170 RepID=UPI003D0E56F3